MRVDRQSLERLEWGELTEVLARQMRTPMGRRRALALAPVEQADQVLAVQQQVEAMRLRQARFGSLPLGEVADPVPLLEVLQVEGKSLPGEAIYQMVRLLIVAREVAAAMRQLDPADYPALSGQWARFPDLEAVIGAIEGKISSTGELEDHASAELARLREEIRSLGERLTSVLEKLIKAEWTGPVLRDRYITVRNDRYVLPVRTDTPRRFHGIVHGSSSTEKTLFVEPMETVEINNRLVALKEEEAREVERILARFSALLRSRRDEIAVTVDVLGEIDLLAGLAAWAEQTGACCPEMAPECGVVLEQARHPLLEASLAARGASLVPLDLDLPRELRGLVISGPNAGGKTVALKTVGLAVLMAHAGIPVPARRARLPLLGAVMADIGDEQSLEGGVSTFSSHIRNLARMLEELRAPALALIDEIGTGTDPAEGAALGTAVLDRLLASGVHVVATTHHLAVKTWAYRREGVTNAACEFDEQSLSPTYRLVPGVAGSSIGLTMAAQLGLDPEVVEEARRRLDPAGAEAARALEGVESLATRLAAREAELTERRRRLEEQARREQERWEEREEARRRQWSERLDELARSFRQQAREMIARLEDARQRRRLEREQARRERELRQRFEAEGRAARSIAPAPPEWEPAIGEKIWVASLGREGVVLECSEQRAEVQLGRARFTVSRADLRPLGEGGDEAGAGTPTTEAASRRPVLPAAVSADLPDKVVPVELHLLGFRVDEALAAVDKYLDDVCLAGHREVRIVHGLGTGRLRKAVREHLDRHYPALSWQEASPRQGGAGATVVRLEES